MSQNTLVVYFKDEKVKNWLKEKAGSTKSRSVSSLVAKILQEKYIEESQNSPLNKFRKGVGKKYLDSDFDLEKEISKDKSKGFLRSDESYYDKMFTE